MTASPGRPVALVTGARRGIGRAIAEALAAHGFDLALTDIAPEADEALAAIHAHGADAIFARADVGDLESHPATLATVLDRFGRLDCLVNNAGIASPVRGDLLDLRPEQLDRVMAINLRGPLFLTQSVARWMLANPGGGHRSIVNVSSISAELASPERADYCLSKSGLAMLTRLFALRLAEAGICVFEVRPGIIRTDMTAAAAERYEGLIGDGLVPMRRWGEGADIGAAVAALASGAFAFATGTVIQADGGLSIHRL